MKTRDIGLILKQGSVKQKIKLYMTDIALSNVHISHLNAELKEGNLIVKGTKLLSNTEKNLLWSSIKTPKDIKYYNELRLYNAAFLHFKDKFSIDLMKVQALYYLISRINETGIKREQTQELVNDILDLIPDKQTREKVFKKALEHTKDYGGREYQKETGFSNYLEVDSFIFWDEVKHSVELAIANAKGCKEYILMFKNILDNKLPLKPYKEWLQAQEKHLAQLIELIHTLTTCEDAPPDFPKIELYQEIKVEITEEDIEDFKNAGI